MYTPPTLGLLIGTLLFPHGTDVQSQWASPYSLPCMTPSRPHPHATPAAILWPCRPSQVQSPGQTPERGEAAGPSPGGRGCILSANRGKEEDRRCPAGLGEGRALGSSYVCLRAPHPLQGSALSFLCCSSGPLPTSLLCRSFPAPPPPAHQWGWGHTPSPHSWPAGGQAHAAGSTEGDLEVAGRPSQVHASEGSSKLTACKEDFNMVAFFLESWGRAVSQGPSTCQAGSELAAPALLIPLMPALKGKRSGFPQEGLLKLDCVLKKKCFRGAVPHRRHDFTCSVEEGIAPRKSTLALVSSAGWTACLPGEPRALPMPEAFKLIFWGVSHSWMGHCLEKTAIMQPFISLLRESLKWHHILYIHLDPQCTPGTGLPKSLTAALFGGNQATKKRVRTPLSINYRQSLSRQLQREAWGGGVGRTTSSSSYFHSSCSKKWQSSSSTQEIFVHQVFHACSKSNKWKCISNASSGQKTEVLTNSDC